MNRVFSSLRARIVLLIAVPFVFVLGLTAYHALGARPDQPNLSNPLALSVLFALTIGIVWLGSKTIFMRRIAALAGAATKLGEGNLTIRVGSEASGDEIGQLAQSVDRIAEGLQSKEEQLRRTVRALRVLSAANRTLAYAKDGELRLLEEMCRAIGGAGGYRLAWVGYVQPDAAYGIQQVAHWRSSDKAFNGNANIAWGETESRQTPLGKAIFTGMPVVVKDVAREPGPPAWREYALRCRCGSCIALPLSVDEGIIGVLNICAEEKDAFSDEDVNLLSEAAAGLAFGIASQRAKAERDRIAQTHRRHEALLRKSLEDSIRAIANTLEMRDPYTAGHQRRIAELAAAIATELGLPEDEIHGIELAASIHDLGRIQIDKEILTKPDKLTDSEFALIKTHSRAGYDILKGIEFPWPIADIVLQHHERLDGSGYPQGLEGEQILLGSRIMAVADVLEAMASERPYRLGLGIDVALKEIERGRGTAFDPAVVDACLKLFREERFAFQVT